MNMAFSVDSPIIKLRDVSNQTERGVQIGFMEIFAGSMTGIRNPSAHANRVIDAEENQRISERSSIAVCRTRHHTIPRFSCLHTFTVASYGR